MKDYKKKPQNKLTLAEIATLIFIISLVIFIDAFSIPALLLSLFISIVIAFLYWKKS